MRITAVIVAYNRLETLTQVLPAVCSQSHRLEHIVVVDNCSTDGTADHLKAAARADSRIHVIHSPENTGGAGGFRTGTLYASGLPADYLWLMDDDVVPEPDCLARLVEYAEKGYFILQPVRLQPSGARAPEENTLNFTQPLAHVTRSLGVKPVENGSDAEFTVSLPFEGPLISKAVFAEIGFPDDSFFITSDDLDFAIRSHKHGFQIVYVKSAIMHRVFEAKSVSSKSGGLPPLDWKEYYLIRNLIEVDWRYAPLPVTLLRASKLLAKFLYRSVRNRDATGVEITLTAFLHGFLRVRGKTVNPGPWKGRAA